MPEYPAAAEDIDHRQFKSRLSDEQRRSLTRLRNMPGVLRLTVHAGCIVLLAAAISMQVPCWPVLMLPLGILLVFLFTLLHESIHQTAFRSKWMNRWVARLCGLVLLLPPLWFQYFHWAHHRHTQIKGKDPELDFPKPATFKQYLWYISGFPVWFSHVTTLVSLALGKRQDVYVPVFIRSQTSRQAVLMCACYLALALVSYIAGSALLFFIWIAPLIAGQPFLRLYLLAEHTGCPNTSSMVQNTRTVLTNRIVRLFAWNMPFHTEHHVYPAVPFHQLPELHRLLSSYLCHTQQGYLRFNHRYVTEDCRQRTG